MFRKSTFVLVAIAALSLPARAQSPMPIVVQAANAPTSAPAATGQAIAPQPASSAASAEAILKTLLELKAANEEILRKQAATLSQLEEMEKAADQIKIYTKRG
jgi:exo-beta-1,3-glucanase (GH17 family)